MAEWPIQLSFAPWAEDSKEDTIFFWCSNIGMCVKGNHQTLYLIQECLWWSAIQEKTTRILRGVSPAVENNLPQFSSKFFSSLIILPSLLSCLGTANLLFQYRYHLKISPLTSVLDSPPISALGRICPQLTGQVVINRAIFQAQGSAVALPSIQSLLQRACQVCRETRLAFG